MKVTARKKEGDKFTSSILLKVTAAKRLEIQDHARNMGLGVNSFIRMAVDREMLK